MLGIFKRNRKPQDFDEGYFAFYVVKNGKPSLYRIDRPMTMIEGRQYINKFCQEQGYFIRNIYFEPQYVVLDEKIRDISRRIAFELKYS